MRRMFDVELIDPPVRPQNRIRELEGRTALQLLLNLEIACNPYAALTLTFLPHAFLEKSFAQRLAQALLAALPL